MCMYMHVDGVGNRDEKKILHQHSSEIAVAAVAEPCEVFERETTCNVTASNVSRPTHTSGNMNFSLL